MKSTEDFDIPLLILDLDETLIHAVPGTVLIDGVEGFLIEGFAVHRRPGLQAFLDYCFSEWRVAIWTSATDDYCRAILEEIAPGREFDFVWSRERCVRRRDPETGNEYFLKPVGKVQRRGYDRARILAIDDSPEKWAGSYGNYLRVEEFVGSSDDRELQRLITYLRSMSSQSDFRRIEKRGWRGNL